MDQARAAYESLRRFLHPDRSGALPIAEERVRLLSAAWDALRSGGAGHTAAKPTNVIGRLREATRAMVFNFRVALRDDDLGAEGRGRDHRVRLDLDPMVAQRGGAREVEFPLLMACLTCRGQGGLEAEDSRSCHVCGGLGRGPLASPKDPVGPLCPLCGGGGRLHACLCGVCEGRGNVTRRLRLSVMVPPGTKSGDCLRLAGRGAPGPAGAPPGDLVVDITVRAPLAGVDERPGS